MFGAVKTLLLFEQICYIHAYHKNNTIHLDGVIFIISKVSFVLVAKIGLRISSCGDIIEETREGSGKIAEKSFTAYWLAENQKPYFCLHGFCCMAAVKAGHTL